jgi:hypothetical protein
MKRINHSTVLSSKAVIALLTLMFLLSFTHNALAKIERVTAEASEIKQILMMPVITAEGGARQIKALNETLDCELSGLCLLNQDRLTHAEQVLTQQLMQGLAEHYGDKVLPQPPVTTHYLSMFKGQDETARDIAVRLGHELNADHVMVGLNWRFTQRDGGALTADSPASVAFSVFLVNVASKELVWAGNFDKTQQALSDNLFNASLFFKTGIKWLTAEELAEFGVGKALEDVPQSSL